MSKIKLVPVPNITKRELMTALMDGRKFCINSERVNHLVIHWDENHGHSPVRQGLERWNWRGFKYLCELAEQQWYEDPDMVGKVVKVKQMKAHTWSLDYFGSWAIDGVDCFYCERDVWAYAEPLTAADLYQEQV